MEDSVRSMLDRLEAELHSKIDAIRRQLAPLERELADVRKAKAALSPVIEEALPMTAILSDAPDAQDRVLQSPYAAYTMKELTLKALREQFPRGATSNELLDFFAHAWGRTDVERSSLSPQLSRLKRECRVRLLHGKIWILPENCEQKETPSEDQSEGVSEPDGDSAPSIERREAGSLFAETSGERPANPEGNSRKEGD